MTTIAIVPENPQGSPSRFRAVAGEAQSVGATVGQALDALQAQLGAPEQTTLVVVQPMQPDGGARAGSAWVEHFSASVGKAPSAG
jgi:hypothetical protein